MKHPSITQRVIFFTASLTILIVAIAIFIILPAMKKTVSLRDNVTKTQQALEHDYQKTLLLRRSIRELDAVYGKTQMFNTATIENGDELTVITQLENLASKHDVDQTLHVTFTDPKSIPAKERGKSASKTNLPYYTFSFLNHGTFAQHIEYLKALEQLPYYVLIEGLQWEQRSAAGQVTLRFDGRVYASTP